MAIIIPNSVSEQVRSNSYQWAGISTGDTASPATLQNMQGLAGSVQVSGTFGGATVTMQVSNDGANYATMSDTNGVALSFAGAGFGEFSTAGLYIRPIVLGGSGDSVTVTVILRG